MLSPCRRYRYALERRWGAGPFVMFIGLNPSVADEVTDDATIRVCRGYAKRWGFGGMLMGNLYGYRATHPVELAAAEDPVGFDTDVWLTTMRLHATTVVAAWGSHAMATPERVADVLELVGSVTALATTKSGAPRHPLRLRADLQPQPWSLATSSV